METTTRRPQSVASFESAAGEAYMDLAFDMDFGSSMLYVLGSATCHHVNAVITPGSRVCRTTDISRAANVAANHRRQLVTLAKLLVDDEVIFEVWVA